MKNKEIDLGLVEPNIEIVHDIGVFAITDEESEGSVAIYYNKSELDFEEINVVLKDCIEKGMTVEETLKVLIAKFKENIMI